MRATRHFPTPRRTHQSGFTLAEVLLSGTLAAVLLTALAQSTMQFGYTISYLEEKAGIADVTDAVMRRMTRDIRESWWVELEGDDHLLLSDVDGEITEYFVEAGQLILRRPNGDEGVVVSDVNTAAFEASTAPRQREGEPATIEAPWYVQAAPATAAMPLEAASGGSVALSFTPPVSALAVGAGASEEILAAELETLSLPVAFIPAAGADPGSLTVSIYETRGPGKAKPLGAAKGSLVVPSASLPQATMGASSWNVPTTSVALALSVDGALDPARGYALVLQASEGASFVVPAHPIVGGGKSNPISTLGTSPGSQWVELPMLTPFSLTGPAEVTTTEVQQMVTTVSISLQIGNRPLITRSASVLSQTIGESPWLGVVPGEEAP